MSDLLDKIHSTLNDWDDKSTVLRYDDMTASRASFCVVRDNPGITVIKAVELLHSDGHKITSTTSLIGSMVRQKMLRMENGQLFACQAEYTPLKYTSATSKKKRAPAAPQVQYGLPALQAKEPPPRASLDIDALILRLNVYEFTELRAKLNTIWIGKD
jgi:hypothetical protein